MDKDDDESDDESDNDILTPEMLQGLLEALFLMRTAVAKQLDSVSFIIMVTLFYCSVYDVLSELSDFIC